VQKRRFGNTKLEVSILGFGAAQIGFEGTDDRTVDKLLGVAQEVGINVIDTAVMYRDSEEKIGRSLVGRRDEFLIFTKCGRYLPPIWTLPGLGLRILRKVKRPTASNGYDAIDWHPTALRWDIDESLRRLRTERIELLLLHSCSEDMLRRADVVEVLQRAREAGKISHIGYSGDGPALRYAISCGEFAAVEMSINIADQEAIDNALPLAQKSGLGVIAKRPIANGLWRSLQRPDEDKNVAYWERLHDLNYSFLRSADGFGHALRFTISIPGVHTALVGTTNPGHVRQNAQSVEHGLINESKFKEIRGQWKNIAKSNWLAQM